VRVSAHRDRPFRHRDRRTLGARLQAVLKPLFVTSPLIDDFLDDSHRFGATQLLLSSASSKTAYGTAFCLAQRRGTAGMPRVVGLTSPGNLGFTQDLGCHDEVRPQRQRGRQRRRTAPPGSSAAPLRPITL
jgi:hypothetical protein